MKLAQATLTLFAATMVALGAAASSSAAEGPVLGAAGGCALQCIEKALVTSTASSAKVEIGTTVPVKVEITVRRLSNIGGVPDSSATGPTLRTARSLFLYGLKPKTAYRIRVTATDAAGRTAFRAGTFETREVETAVGPGPGGLSSGLGCSAECITRAVPVQIGPTAALFEVETDTPARITVITSLAGTGSIVSISTSASLTTLYRHAASPLNPGTQYDIVMRATDAQGRTKQHQYTFTTIERKARVTFWKIKVIDDGDRGKNRGELSFGYWLGGAYVSGSGFQKRSSGDVFDVTARGSSRHGLSAVIPANGSNPKLDITVQAVECDSVLMSNCTDEVVDYVPSGGGASGGYEWATAGGGFALSALLAHGALPGGYGTVLPSGHGAYAVFETTQYHVKFRVYAFVDYFYDW